MNPMRLLLIGLAGCCSALAQDTTGWIRKWESYATPTSGFVMVARPRPELATVLKHLPAPESWPTLATELKAAETAAGDSPRGRRLRLGRWLLEDFLGRRENLLSEIQAAKKAGYLEEYFANEMTEALGKAADASPETRVKAFEAAIAEQTGPRRMLGGDYVPGVALPDLVTLIGEERAAILLRRALAARALLEPEDAADATETLARRLALEQAEQLAVPQWKLAASLDAVPLFEALIRRFGAPKDSDYRHQEARRYYIIGLILADRPADALREAQAAGDEFSIPYDLGSRLGRAGHEERVRAFLHAYLTARPEAADSLWSDYRRLSVTLGEQARMLSLIRAQAEDKKLEGVARIRASRRLALAELAVDDLAAGTPRLAAALASARALPGENKTALSLAGEVFTLGRALEDATLTAEGAAALLNAGRDSLAAKEESYAIASDARDALSQLVAAGREPEALELATAIEARMAALAKEPDTTRRHGSSRDVLPAVLTARLRFAVAAGRWDEAAALLENSPAWGAADAAALIRESSHEDGLSFGVLVARVLAARGDTAGARRALEARLVLDAGEDSAYADYVDLLGAGAIPLLDTLYSLDPYEERPLIWKAVLAARAGDHAEAERLARAAITVDPSDGEQGRGDRMRVYSVLATARAARGDASEAEFFNRVVSAIRLSETADAWHKAGLYTRSIEGYRRALGLFADAYCVQSRLAIRLIEQGRTEEAMIHYQKAYELMPGSFGRVESHCFGCESAFDGERQQGVAERVFERMAAEDPAKPQVPYLLGYLREEQERFVEAAALYRRAVELDPLYLNAWKKLAGLGDRMALSGAERDHITLQLLRLDPLARHFYPDLDEVADGPALWSALTAAQARASVLPRHASVLPLPASAAALKADTGTPSRPQAERLTPAQVFAERDFARQIGWAVQAQNR